MGINIFCIYNEKGAWYKNEKVKRSLFGLGARCCTLYPGFNEEICEYQIKPERSKHPPPPPSKRIIYEGFIKLKRN